MQSANELLRVLYIGVQAFYPIHQLHQRLSLLDVLCLNLQIRSGIMRAAAATHMYAVKDFLTLHHASNHSLCR